MNIFIKYRTPVSSSVPITRNVRKLHFIVKKLRIGHVTSNAKPPASKIMKRYIGDEGRWMFAWNSDNKK